MSFLDKIIGRKPGVQSPELVTELAKETSDRLADEKFSFAKAHREFRQHRRDAHIRAELKKTRAYAISSRPRTPQAKATVVGRSPRYLELSNGQVLRTNSVLRNPRLILLRETAKAA